MLLSLDVQAASQYKQCLVCAVACVIKGATKVGLNLVVFTVHPMKVGATLMSSFLFNVALVLLATQAAIQFCAQAFELYANNSAIQKIWGGQVRHCDATMLHDFCVQSACLI